MKLFYMKQIEMIIPINIFLTLLVNSACKSEKNVFKMREVWTEEGR